MKGNVIKSAIAWTGTACLLGYVLITTDLTEAWRALQNAHIGAFLAAVTGFTVVKFLAQTATACVLLQRSGFSVTQAEFRRIRGISSLPSSVNYFLSQAATVTLLSWRSRRGIVAVTSPLLLLNFIDLSAVCLLAVMALALGSSPLGREATLIVGLCALGGLLGGPVLVSLSRIKVLPPWVRGKMGQDLLTAFRVPSVKDLAWVYLLRTLNLGINLLELCAYLLAFGFAAPMMVIMLMEPILIIVSVLPISVGGIGSTQVASRELLAAYAPAGTAAIPTVDALSASIIAGVTLVKAGIGIWYVPSAIRQKRKEP